VVARHRVGPQGLTRSDYTDFTTHPLLIDHRTWTSTSFTDDVTTDLIAFYLATAAGKPMGEKLSHFSYLHAKIRIKIVTQGQPFAFGQIVAAFTPRVDTQITVASRSAVRALNITNAKVVPHIIIDPSKTETYEIDLPICTPTGYWSLKGTNFGSYDMTLWAYNALGSGTATPAVTGISTYMSLIDPIFEGMTLLSNAFVEEKKSEGTISGFIKRGSKAVNLLSVPFPEFAPEIALFSTVSGYVGDFLALLGFSKPPIAENQLFPLTRVVDNLSQFDGKSTAIVLAGSQATSVGLSADFGGGKMEELSIAHLCAIPGLFSQTSVTPAVASGSLLQRLSVDPMRVMSFSGGSLLNITPLAGTAWPFTHWTGDLTLRLEIVASVFHRATLLLAWDPIDSFPTARTMEDAVMTLQNVTINVSGNTCVDVTIPWKQQQPWADLRAPSTTTNTQARFSNGEILLFVVNPVTSNGSTDGIGLNWYWYSKNIKFAVPDNNRIMSAETSMVLLSEEFCPITPISFGPTTSLEHSTLKAFGEDYVSIKQVTTKLTPSWNATFAVTATPADLDVGFHMPNFPQYNTNLKGSSGDTAGLSMNLFTWYATAFLGYRGSIRYSFTVQEVTSDKDRTVLKDFYSMMHRKIDLAVINQTRSNSSLVTAENSYAFTQGNRQISPRMDGVAPMLIPYDYFPLQNYYTHASNFVDVTLPVRAAVSGSQSVNMRCCTASGDDGNFVWFMGYQCTFPT